MDSNYRLQMHTTVHFIGLQVQCCWETEASLLSAAMYEAAAACKHSVRVFNIFEKQLVFETACNLLLYFISWFSFEVFISFCVDLWSHLFLTWLQQGSCRSGIPTILSNGFLLSFSLTVQHSNILCFWSQKRGKSIAGWRGICTVPVST